MENNLSLHIVRQALVHTMSDHLSDAVIFTNEYFIIEYLNDTAKQLLGFSGEENIGKNIRSILSGNYHEGLFEEITSQLILQGCWKGTLNFPIEENDVCKLESTILSSGEKQNGNTGFVIISKVKELPGNSIHESENKNWKEVFLSEQKWRSVLNNTKGAIFLIDTNCHIVFVNEKAEKILSHSPGWATSKEKIYFPDLLPEERREPFKEVFNRALRGEKVEYEVFYTKKNKQPLWLLASCMPMKNNDGVINQVCITTYNITALKEKEAELTRSEQRWKFALDGAGDGVWEYNFQTKESYYSPLYKKMLGFNEDEFLNKAYEWQTRVHPDDYHKISNIDDLYEKGTIENHAVEYRLKNKSGGYVWVLDRGMLLERTPDGKPLKLIGTHTNITERKLAEERLAKSEKRFSSFMDNTPTMTWIIDEHNIFRYLNTSYIHSFKITGEAIGKSVYDVFPKEICDRFIENNWKVWDRNMAIEVTEEGIGPDGQKQIYHIYKFPLDPENGVRMLGGVALDITKKAELEQQLAAEEAQKKREIIQAIINAQEKERKEISYELHDNVNQILTSSKLMLEVAVEKPELSREFTYRCLDYLKAAIAEIRKISHSLTPAALRDISLEAAVEDVVENINATGKLKVEYYNSTNQLAKNIEPEKQLAILRIIQEQFNNILKHAGATEVTISLVGGDSFLSLEIQDNGCGFDPENTKRGLGLNNMFNRVEYYNGFSRLISSPGKGCTLYIEFPV
jgi:PAS domain S-box-containing protein